MSVLSVSAADRIPVADKRKYEMYLERFETSRTHYRPDGKENLQNATIFMKEKFESVGLDVDLQNFTTSDTTTGQVSCYVILIEPAHIQLFPEAVASRLAGEQLAQNNYANKFQLFFEYLCYADSLNLTDLPLKLLTMNLFALMKKQTKGKQIEGQPSLFIMSLSISTPF